LAIKDQEIEEEKMKPEETSAPENTLTEIPEKKVKSDKLIRQIEALETELELERRKSSDMTNRMRYLQADIANLQRQADRRVSEVRNQVKLTWILEVLSIKEDLDRALGVARETNDRSTLLDGLLLVASRIENILKLESVEVIRAEVGGRFDPHQHEALAFQESESEEQGTILAVISPGYSVDGKVIKPAMVEVARRKDPKKTEESQRVEKGMTVEGPTGQDKS
jgi:molecular chaperone GrpE